MPALVRFPRGTRTAFLIAALLPMLVANALAAPRPMASAREQNDAPQVDRLIEQLGAPQYATRERAAAALTQLGLDAFDALHAAQSHPDHEISERARYLLYSMRVGLSRPTDSPEVKRILKDYSDLEDRDRQTRIEQLARLDATEGIEALCRLARYELSTILSKKAALAIMTRRQFAEPQVREALRHAITSEVDASNRIAGHWLRTYLQALDDPARTAETWNQLIAQERALYDAAINPKDPDKNRLKLPETERQIVSDLYRYQADMLEAAGRNEAAIEAVRQMVGLSDGSREQLMETVDWLLNRKSHAVIDEIAAKFDEQFKKDPWLLYRLAESQAARGEKERAEKTAAEALAIAPQSYDQHRVIGYQLQGRGLFAWAEREYRYVITSTEMITSDGIAARILLAEMMHDLAKEKEAADAVADLVQAMEADAATESLVRDASSGRSPDEITSRMYFFRALEHLGRKEYAQAKTALQKGARASAQADDEGVIGDADLLIAMYRLPEADEAWKKEAREEIKKTATRFYNWIQQFEMAIRDRDLDEGPTGESARAALAMFCNQYAWLVGNTEGDYQEAIRLSHRSLELRPHTAGYMDTLAHCYFTAGDLENAVKWQTRAVRLEPHSGQLVRALARFEKAYAEKKNQSAPQP